MKALSVSFLLFVLAPIVTFAQPFSTQAEWETYFQNRIQTLDPIEGIWSQSYTLKVYDSYNRLFYDNYRQQASKLAIYKSGNIYKVYWLTDNKFKSRRSFQRTATTGIFLHETYYLGSKTYAKANAILTGNSLLEFKLEEPTAEVKHQLGSSFIEGHSVFSEHNWIKISPIIEDYTRNQKASGTGFAVSSNGIIVTNHHVIKDAHSIVVRGINSDFNKSYNANVMLSDKNNDIAVIQINDNSFTSLGTIPYTIKTGLARVGEDIFVLGYPLRGTMGDEIKITNGIVSSSTGYQGDVTSYQISAPIQPGNSGGPLFDSQGNLVGIINAKHSGAENASYAIKTSYLTNLINLIPSQPRLQTVNSLTGKTLSEQVESAKRFVYIIETN